MSIPSQRDSAVDAGDVDRRAAVADASAQLAMLHLADDGDRQIGIDAAVDAVDVDLGAGLGRRADFDAPVDAVNAQPAFAQTQERDRDAPVNAVQFRGRSCLGDYDSAVDAVDAHFACDRSDVNLAVNRRHFQVDVFRQLQPRLVAHPSAIPSPPAAFLIFLAANRQAVGRGFDDYGLALHRRNVRSPNRDIDLGPVTVPGLD